MAEITVQLPDPTDWMTVIGPDDQDTTTPHWDTYWDSVTAWRDGVEIERHGLCEDLGMVREYALALLAAVHQVEQWQDTEAGDA